MSLLTICTELANNVGLEVPSQVISSPKREWSEAVSMANAVGDELARRGDFGALREVQSVVGAGDVEFDLGSGFSRIIPGIGVTYGQGIVRPLTQAEWASLEAVEGSPRYFLLEGRMLRLWPYLPTGNVTSVRYQSKYWCSNGTDAWVADTDTSLIDEELFAKGLIVRWRRQKGMPFEDYEAEYEQALADIARFDDRSRIG